MLASGTLVDIVGLAATAQIQEIATAETADRFMLRSGDRQIGRAGVHNRGTWNGSVTAEVITSTDVQ